jgi:uncharacterized protein with GYD domain
VLERNEREESFRNDAGYARESGGKEEVMPYYVILSTLTDEGRRTIKEKPERILEVGKEVEAMGVKTVAQYVVLGQYDFVSIVEAPDNETIMKVSTHIGARGSVQLMTLPALPVEEFVKKLK